MKRDWKSWNHDANGRRVIIIGRYAVVVDSLILFPVRCDVVLLSSLGRGGSMSLERDPRQLAMNQVHILVASIHPNKITPGPQICRSW